MLAVSVFAEDKAFADSAEEMMDWKETVRLRRELTTAETEHPGFIVLAFRS